MPFTWQRVAVNVIVLYYEGAALHEPVWAEYTITITTELYGVKLFKLTNNNYTPNELASEGFGNNPGALFRRKR